LSEERLEQTTINIEWLQKNANQFLDVVEYHKEYKYPDVPNLDVDAALYQNGFTSDEERVKCNEFHTTPLTQKISFIEQLGNNSHAQAIRIIGRNYPEHLEANKLLYNEFSNYLKKIKSEEIIVDYKNRPKLSREGGLSQIDNLIKTKVLGPEQVSLLRGLTKYIQSW
jgi:exodeoxyribonuclease I